MRTIVALTQASMIAIALLGGGACKPDNSSDTDKASRDLRKAQDEVNGDRKAVADHAADIAKHTQALGEVGEKLGSAQATLAAARSAYTAAVHERFAKLDADLATLATRVDAKSKDAYTGLKARRDALSAKLNAMAATPDTGWTPYTQDVDATFGAIETDLSTAPR